MHTDSKRTRQVKGNFALLYLVAIATLILLVLIVSYVHNSAVDQEHQRDAIAAQRLHDREVAKINRAAIRDAAIFNCKQTETFKAGFAEVIESRRKTLPTSGYYLNRPKELKEALDRNAALLRSLAPVDCEKAIPPLRDAAPTPSTGATGVSHVTPTAAASVDLMLLLLATP